nr:hypothetical protein Itr_chr08CG19850 [Ipomoea trifida]
MLIISVSKHQLVKPSLGMSDPERDLCLCVSRSVAPLEYVAQEFLNHCQPLGASALAIEKKDFSAYFSAQPAKLGGSEPIGDLGAILVWCGRVGAKSTRLSLGCRESSNGHGTQLLNFWNLSEMASLIPVIS